MDYYTFMVVGKDGCTVKYLIIKADNEEDAFFEANSRVSADCIVELEEVECGA